MEYKYYFLDGVNVIEVPEFKGKDIDFSDMNSLYEIIGYPDPEEPEDWEIEEYMEDNDCDRDEAIDALEEKATEDLYETAPTVTIDSIESDDESGFDHFEVTVEAGFDGARSSCGYVELTEDEIEIIYKYIISQL